VVVQSEKVQRCKCAEEQKSGETDTEFVDRWCRVYAEVVKTKCREQTVAEVVQR